MVNGRKSLLTIPDAELRDLYLVRGLAPLEIAECHHAPYRAVLRRLRHLGIFESHRNDKHPEKYQRGHTSDSVVKMRQTIQAGYDAGRTPWNKDLREGDHPGVDRQAEFLRTHHHNNVPGEASSAWGGGVSRGHGQRKMAAVRECQVCGSPGDLHVHHRDENPRNNADENLVKVCTNCHAKLHHGWWVGVVTHPDEIVSIREIGVEDVYDLEMEAPFHNYVADGFIVHNSTRFCNYGNDRFGGEISVTVPHWGQESLIDKPQYPLWERAMRAAESAYMEWIALGGKPDEARVVLPNGLKAEIYVTMNLREWMYVFSLRTAQEAHPGMRLVMKSLRDQFREHLPVFFEEDWFRPGASWRKIVKAILMADSLAEAQRIAREALSLPANGTEDNRP
jgi:hypothetical protein